MRYAPVVGGPRHGQVKLIGDRSRSWQLVDPANHWIHSYEVRWVVHILPGRTDLQTFPVLLHSWPFIDRLDDAIVQAWASGWTPEPHGWVPESR